MIQSIMLIANFLPEHVEVDPFVDEEGLEEAGRDHQHVHFVPGNLFTTFKGWEEKHQI